MIENKSNDLIAKLLANENISVVMARTSTASFNIETRVLTLPQWKETTPEITGMLIAHEVGHALETTTEYYNHDVKEKHFQGYLNVLEDVRIEKLMKRRYPGLRKTFTEGYKQLNEKDFFGIKTQDIQDLLLIDRINLYFKAGMACGVTFTRDEKLFIERAERTETIQEVIALAKDIYEFSKEYLEKKKEEAKKAKAEEPEDQDGDSDEEESEDQAGDSDESDEEESEDQDMDSKNSDDAEDGEDDESSVDSSTGLEDHSVEDDLESKTESALKNNIEDLADTSVEYRYVTLGKFGYDPLISYKTIISDFTSVSSEYPVHFSVDKEAVSQFKTSTSNVVNYLVKEFEMKKAASMYKRAKVAKVGQLDTRKLATYQLKDDIFKSVTTYNAGKNHGMIIIVDWSGSMQNCIKETIEQVINLAMFCARSQIPYQVFAFSDAYRNVNREEFAKKYRDNNKSFYEFSGDNELNVNTANLSMLELFSSKMSSSEMNRMIDILKSKQVLQFLRLNGTPLNEALAYVYEYLPKFKRQFNSEKMTFITLTDGQGGRLQARNNIEHMRYVYATNTRVQIKNFLTDPISKKSYKISNDSCEQTNALLSMIKDAYGVTTLGFYLTSTSWKHLESAIGAHYGFDALKRNVSGAVDRLKTEIRANGFASLKGTGRDDLFIVPLTSTKIIDENFDAINTTQTAAQIARKFGKVLNTKKTSRILLSKFIDYVA
jgi:hypothetical protein